MFDSAGASLMAPSLWDTAAVSQSDFACWHTDPGKFVIDRGCPTGSRHPALPAGHSFASSSGHGDAYGP